MLPTKARATTTTKTVLLSSTINQSKRPWWMHAAWPT